MKSELFDSANSTVATSNDARRYDLSDSGDRRRLALRIKWDIDDACVRLYDDGHRNHLGASMIGEPCARKLWSVFRWLKHEKTTGRQQRLFNRGHREEERFVEWLRAIGCEVQEFDTSVDGEQTQIRVSGVNGHFGGSLDGRLKLPERYGVTEPVLLCEFKTSGTGAKFNNLDVNGVQFEKPLHYAQMSTYGRKYGYKYAIYLCINKNDDDLYIEIVELDWEYAATLEVKAEEVINSQIPPQKISQSPTAFNCKFCHFSPICHSGELPEKNCRSCVHAVPIENAQWGCNKHQGIIPKDFIPKGCDDWEPITQ